MNHRVLSKCFFLILSLIISGCLNTPTVSSPVVESKDTPTVPAPTRTKPPVIVSSPTQAETPTPTSLPILTPTLMPTHTPTATMSPLEKARLKMQCLEILPEFPPGVTVTGTLVLEWAGGSETSYLLDIATHAPVPIPKSNREEYVIPAYLNVSPDGNWLAYEGPASAGSTIYELVVRNLDGSQQYVYPTDTDTLQYAQLSYWVNNEWLAFIEIEDLLDTLIFFNPFTGEQQVMPNDYPDIDPLDEIHGWQTHTTYDPSLRWVVYLSYTKDTGYKIVLWDRATNQTIIEVPDLEVVFLPPVWLQDGSGFIYLDTKIDYDDTTKELDSRREEFVFMNLEKDVIQLTHLTEYYSQTMISEPAISPDGQYLAFQLWKADSTGWRNFQQAGLTVLNLTTLEVTNYCLQADHLVWSLDSQYLALSISDRETQTNQVLVADLAGGYAVQVAENLWPRGWMRSGP